MSGPSDDRIRLLARMVVLEELMDAAHRRRPRRPILFFTRWPFIQLGPDPYFAAKSKAFSDAVNDFADWLTSLEGDGLIVRTASDTPIMTSVAERLAEAPETSPPTGQGQVG